MKAELAYVVFSYVAMMLWLYELIPDVAPKRQAMEDGNFAWFPRVTKLALQIPSRKSWRIPSFDNTIF